MTHVAILGRMFNREVINLGFSGNGRMEPEVTKLMAELDPAVFVLDCLPNMTAKDINERAEACVKTLRTAHPKTPILLVEDRNYADNFLNASRRERNETNHVAMRAVYAKLQRDKVPVALPEGRPSAGRRWGSYNRRVASDRPWLRLSLVSRPREFQEALAKIAEIG